MATLKEGLSNAGLRGNGNGYKVVEVSTDTNDIIGMQLHPDAEYRFETFFGKVYSLGNALRFIKYENFKLNMLNKKLPHIEFRKFRKETQRDVKHYWDLAKLVIADRLVSDRELLKMINNEHGDDILNTRFIPYVKVRRGIIQTKVPNDKLKVYGVILSRLIQTLITEHGDIISDGSDEEYADAMHAFKINVWNDVAERVGSTNLEEQNIAKGFFDITDKKLLDAFIGTDETEETVETENE